MKTFTKFWLGVFTFLPLVCFLIFIALFFTVFLEQALELEQHQGEFPFEFLQSIFGFVIFLIVIILVSLGVKIYYIIDTNTNALNDTNKKILWTLVLIFGGTVASIIYYFIEIVPKKIEQ